MGRNAVIVWRVLYLLGWAGVLFVMFRRLIAYSTDQRQLNSAPHWWNFNFQTGWQSPDTTVSAYARQVHEHARLNDELGVRLTEGLTVEDFERTETVTEARTEQDGSV